MNGVRVCYLDGVEIKATIGMVEQLRMDPGSGKLYLIINDNKGIPHRVFMSDILKWEDLPQ